MKKIILIITLIILLIISNQFIINKATSSVEFESNDYKLNDEYYNSKGKKYEDVIFNLLYPIIKEEVDKYYLQYLKSSPSLYSYYQTKFLNLERLNGTMRVTIQVCPVYGPHIAIGLDNITFKIKYGNTIVEKYEHIKSFKLPERYEFEIKEGFNNPIP